MMGIPLGIANLASSYLPVAISQAWEPQRDVARISITPSLPPWTFLYSLAV